MAIKILNKFLITIAVFSLCSGSAIPMWEYLSRTEKMSNLYSTFAQFVSDYCKQGNDVRLHNLSIAQCKRDLLAHGSNKLQKMSDNNLDLLDPYQRNANEIIWNTIITGHPIFKTTTTRRTTTSPQSQTSAEATILIIGNNNNKPNGQSFPKNPIFDDKHSKYADSLDAVYSNYGDPHRRPDGTGHYLSGPLVFRVKPDGSLIESEFAHDEDVDSSAAQFSTAVQQNTHHNNYYASNNRQHSYQAQQQQLNTRTTVSASKKNNGANIQGILQRERRHYLNSNTYRIQRRH